MSKIRSLCTNEDYPKVHIRELNYTIQWGYSARDKSTGSACTNRWNCTSSRSLRCSSGRRRRRWMANCERANELWECKFMIAAHLGRCRPAAGQTHPGWCGHCNRRCHPASAAADDRLCVPVAYLNHHHHHHHHQRHQTTMSRSRRGVVSFADKSGERLAKPRNDPSRRKTDQFLITITSHRRGSNAVLTVHVYR